MPGEIFSVRKTDMLSHYLMPVPVSVLIFHTKCAGSRKLPTPSLIGYSNPQLPHTSLPSDTPVSSSSPCSFFNTCSLVSSSIAPTGATASPSPTPDVAAAAVVPELSTSIAPPCSTSTTLPPSHPCCSLGFSAGSAAPSPSSVVVVRRASQFSRGRMLVSRSGLYAISVRWTTASLKWRGKESGEERQDLVAQVRKLTVRSFIF